MKFRKILTAIIVLILSLAITTGAFADNIKIGKDGVIIETDNTGTENVTTDPVVTVAPEATATPDPTVTATPVPTDSTGTTETATTDGTNVNADKDAPTIVKHPGDELNRTAGDTVLFTAACSENVQAKWYFNEGVPIEQIGSVYPGVSATVASTIYEGYLPGTKVTISNLTRASSGIKIYVEFTTDYGVLKSDEATITVTQGTDKVVAATPVPTVAPTPTPAASATPAVTSTIAPTQDPVMTSSADSATGDIGISVPDSSVQTTASVSSTNSASVDLSAYNISGGDASSNGGYQFSAEEQSSWSAPGAALAVGACGIIAVLAFLLMALYSMGVLRFRFLERLVGGKDYVSPEDEYDDGEDE